MDLSLILHDNFNTMSQPLFINNSITIHAPAEKVWDALVNPEQTKKYMFGCEAVSDFKPGSPLTWEGTFGGQHMIAVKGHIVAIEAGKLLEYTVIDPNNPGIPDIPENYLTVTYKIEGNGSRSTLSVRQGDYATVADGQKRYTDSYNNGEGWNPILVQIKAICES